MVFVSATPPNGSAASSTPNSPSPRIHRSTSAILTSPYKTEDVPLSLSYLRKKRHSDSSLLDEQAAFNSSGSSPKNKENSEDEPPKLIRKKSGELVKSSLKLNCLTNQSRSMPATPTYKNVHFGQAVDVRYFNEKDKPTAVSANTSPVLKSMSKRWSRSKFGNGATFDFRNGSNDPLIDDCLSDEDDDDDYISDEFIDDEDEDESEVMWDLQTLNFQKIKYNEKFNQKQKIFLERITLDDEAENAIIGYIAVKNLSYHKDVHIRYTFDQWRTVIEIESVFSKESTRILKRAGYDRFVFKIPLKNFKFINKDETKLTFCIRFRYDGEEVWDNNDFRNYEILLTRTIRKRVNKKSKSVLNDYFNTNHHAEDLKFALNSQNTLSIENSSTQNSIPINNYTSSPYFMKDIDSYFNNYEGYKSPETPRALKSGHEDEDGIGTPVFNDLHNFNDLAISEINPLSAKDSNSINSINSTTQREISMINNASTSANRISLLSNESNINLMDFRKKENQSTFNSGSSLNSPISQHKQINQNENNGALDNDENSASSPSDSPNANHKFSTKKPPINSKSYQELLDSYCFFKGEEPTTISTYLNDSIGHSR